MNYQEIEKAVQRLTIYDQNLVERLKDELYKYLDCGLISTQEYNLLVREMNERTNCN